MFPTDFPKLMTLSAEVCLRYRSTRCIARNVSVQSVSRRRRKDLTPLAQLVSSQSGHIPRTCDLYEGLPTANPRCQERCRSTKVGPVSALPLLTLSLCMEAQGRLLWRSRSRKLYARFGALLRSSGHSSLRRFTTLLHTIRTWLAFRRVQVRRSFDDSFARKVFVRLTSSGCLVCRKRKIKVKLASTILVRQNTDTLPSATNHGRIV